MIECLQVVHPASNQTDLVWICDRADEELRREEPGQARRSVKTANSTHIRYEKY
jgi:hypothetical protein